MHNEQADYHQFLQFRSTAPQNVPASYPNTWSNERPKGFAAPNSSSGVFGVVGGSSGGGGAFRPTVHQPQGFRDPAGFVLPQQQQRSPPTSGSAPAGFGPAGAPPGALPHFQRGVNQLEQIAAAASMFPPAGALVEARPPHYQTAMGGPLAPGMRLPAPEVGHDPRTGDRIMYATFAGRLAYCSVRRLRAMRADEGWSWASQIPAGALPRDVPSSGSANWQRLRVGQVTYRWTAEELATVLEHVSCVPVMHAAAQLDKRGRPSGLFMVWVAREDAEAMLRANRSFVCDIEGAWVLPVGEPIPEQLFFDGFFRDGVGKCPSTIEPPARFDASWD